MCEEDVLDKMDRDLKKIIDTCSVDEGHAACYLFNFGDEYICYKYNGGCKKIEQCISMQEKLGEL